MNTYVLLHAHLHTVILLFLEYKGHIFGQRTQVGRNSCLDRDHMTGRESQLDHSHRLGKRKRREGRERERERERERRGGVHVTVRRQHSR